MHQEEILAHSFSGFSLLLLGPSSLGLWQHGTSWQAHEAGGPFTSWWPGSNENERSCQGSNIPLKGTPSDLTSFLWAPPLIGSTTSQWCHRQATKPLVYGLLRDIEEPNHIHAMSEIVGYKLICQLDWIK